MNEQQVQQVVAEALRRERENWQAQLKAERAQTRAQLDTERQATAQQVQDQLGAALSRAALAEREAQLAREEQQEET